MAGPEATGGDPMASDENKTELEALRAASSEQSTAASDRLTQLHKDADERYGAQRPVFGGEAHDQFKAESADHTDVPESEQDAA